jgi:methionine transaminase
MQELSSKLPNVGTTIFTVMSALANEHQAINLSQGFPDFPSDPDLIDRVCHYMQSGFNQYAPMPGAAPLRAAIAEKIERLYPFRPNPESEITVTAGATQAIFTAIATLVRPGDEVIVFEPAYDSYIPGIEVCGGKALPFLLKAPDYRIDWAAVEAMVTPTTRAIMINSPHNPTGTILESSDLLALQHLVKKYGLWVISDEVYEHLIYDGAAHESVLKYPELYKRSFIAFSFGKTFHNTGWKLGYVVAPPLLTAEFRKVHQFNVFSCNTPIQYALADYLQVPSHYEQLPGFYQAKRDFFLQAMSGSGLKPFSCRGTYFQLFDYRSLSDEPDTTFAKTLTTQYGVAAIPVSVFYSSGLDEKVIRLCFAKKTETLEAAALRLQAI